MPETYFITGDITDGTAVLSALSESEATRVIHLAGLQVPTCKADPVMGALKEYPLGQSDDLRAPTKVAGTEDMAQEGGGGITGVRSVRRQAT